VQVKLVHSTPDAEKVIAYCARVSSPNQDNPDYEKLLKYCIKHKHWSVFEQASANFEIVTSRAIAQQILRHRSFHFQEFSQRYAQTQQFEVYHARRQDDKNRQNSIDDMSDKDISWFEDAQLAIIQQSKLLYEEALTRGIAKEQARFLLPLSTQTKLYMHGTIRDFIHYCEVRCDASTQLEHREIADAIKKELINVVPSIAKALNWV
jgi:thymidylate synthase (FAD)